MLLVRKRLSTRARGTTTDQLGIMVEGPGCRVAYKGDLVWVR